MESLDRLMGYKSLSHFSKTFKMLLILAVLLGSVVFINYSNTSSTENSLAADWASPKASGYSPDYSPTEGQNSEAIPSVVRSSSLSAYAGNFNATIEVEQNQAADGFRYVYNETETGGNTFINNNDNETQSRISSLNRYDGIDITVTTGSYKQTLDLVSGSTGEVFSDTFSLAQSIKVDQLSSSYLGSSVIFDTLTLDINTIFNPVNVTAEIWTSTINGTGDLVPNSLVASDFETATTGATTLDFNYSNVSISQSSTNYTSLAGYIFVVLYRTDGNAGSVLVLDSDADRTNLITYQDPNTPAPNADEWDTVLSNNLNIEYNATFNFRPDTIGASIASPRDDTGVVVDASGLYSNTTTVTDPTTEYRFFYTDTLPNSTIAYFNYTYVKYAVKQDLATVTYSNSPDSDLINWTIVYTESLDYAEAADRYFLLPRNFTVTGFYLNDTANSSYSLTDPFNSANQSLNLDQIVTKGEYNITASSTNHFRLLTPLTQRFTSTWISSSNATMGTLVNVSGGADVQSGDLIRSQVDTDPLSLDGIANDLNASLRTTNGLILGPAYTAIQTLGSPNTFALTLDENIPTGIYTYQFRWFNGTAAAAVAVEIEVYPVTYVESITVGSSFNVLEAQTPTLQFATLDLSHNSDWGTSREILWDGGPTTLTLNPGDTAANGTHYIYDATIDTTGLRSVSNGAYLLNVNFTESVHTDVFQVTMNVYHRGSTSLTPPALNTVEYGQDLVFDMQPLNDTGGGGSFDSGDTITFTIYFTNSTDSNVLISSFSTVYSSPTYTITIDWDAVSFEKGSNNQYDIEWSFGDLREVANDPILRDSLTITFVDTTDPLISGPADDTITEDESKSYSLSWTATDSFPDNYTIREVSPTPRDLDTGSWQSGVPIVYSFNPDGLVGSTYVFRLIVEDEDGQQQTDDVELTVNDVTAPTIAGPNDLFINAGAGTTTLQWNVSDNSPDTYQIYLNDNPVGSPVAWSSDNNITYNIDNSLVGENNVTLLALDDTGNPATDTVIVTISGPPTLTLNPSDERIFANENVTLVWQATDIDVATYEVLRDDVQVDTDSWTSGTNITYLVIGLGEGTYNFTIVITDGSGNSVIDTVIVTIDPEGLIRTDQSPTLDLEDQVYEGDIDLVESVWNTDQNEGISAANVSVRLFVVDSNNVTAVEQFEYAFSNTTDGSGNFVLLFNYTSLNPGDYRWIITFTKDNYETATVEIDVELLAHTITIELSYLEILQQGENYTISANVTYATFLANNFGLSGIIQSRGGPVVGVTVEFEILYLSTAGQESRFFRPATTLDNGFATITLSGDDTAGIAEILGISASISGNPSFVSNTVSDPPDNLPAVEEDVFGIQDWLELTEGFINENWEVLLAAIVALILAIAVISRQVRSRRKRRTALVRELETASEETRSLISVQAIILKNSGTGIPFYYETFEEEENALDLSLISSLTTAISTFLSELQEGSTGFETMEREGISLTSHRGTCSDFIVISKDPLPISNFEYIQKSHTEIEFLYADDINNPYMIQEIPDEVITEILVKNGFKVDLKGLLSIDPKPIAKLKEKASISRTIRSNLSYLETFAEMVNEANLPITLTSIMEYLQSLKLTEEVSARLILVAYNNKIIKKDMK